MCLKRLEYAYNYNIMNNNFSNNLYDLRMEYNLKQKELGDKLGLTQRKISYYECGKVEPDLDTLLLLADFFNVSVDFLIGRKGK